MNDESLLRTFEDTTLSRECWTHREHIRVGFLYASRYNASEALRQMRTGLQRFVAAKKLDDGKSQVYHETATAAWLHIIRRAIETGPPCADTTAFCDAHPQLLDKTYIETYYTRELFLSDEARARFVLPDKQPLP